MVYSYTPTYYASLHDTIASLCKSILPFSFKGRRLPSCGLAKRQSNNLKWQQESFHRILNLIGLHKEGIVPESDVAAFRTHLLDILVASPADPDPPALIRDKLLFLQELLYANCISQAEYHSSKRPLVQRLAVQGVEIDSRDLVVGSEHGNAEAEEWSVIELRDKETPLTAKANEKKQQQRSPMKPLKGAAMSLIGMASRGKAAKKKDPPESIEDGAQKGNCSVLMVAESAREGQKSMKTFRCLFQKGQVESSDDKRRGLLMGGEEKVVVAAARPSFKKQWGFDGLKSWKRSSNCQDEESKAPYLASGERSDDAASVACELVASSVREEGPNTMQTKKKMCSDDGSAADFFVDKALGDDIKKELSPSQIGLVAANPTLRYPNDQIEAISTSLPVDKADLNKFFLKASCDRNGDVVHDVAKREFKDHVGEMEAQRSAVREKRSNSGNWVAFEDDEENHHPNLFSGDHKSSSTQRSKNPFADDSDVITLQLVQKNPFANNPFLADENPFWAPRG